MPAGPHAPAAPADGPLGPGGAPAAGAGGAAAAGRAGDRLVVVGREGRRVLRNGAAPGDDPALRHRRPARLDRPLAWQPSVLAPRDHRARLARRARRLGGAVGALEPDPGHRDRGWPADPHLRARLRARNLAQQPVRRPPAPGAGPAHDRRRVRGHRRRGRPAHRGRRRALPRTRARSSSRSATGTRTRHSSRSPCGRRWGSPRTAPAPGPCAPPRLRPRPSASSWRC